MHNAANENKLIVHDIVGIMSDYVSIQPDIDETKVKAAMYVAQNIDLLRNINQENLDRCINPADEADEALKEMVIPALCYFTYSRCLKMFQGVLTDGGYATEGEAESRDAARSVANEMYSIAEKFIEPVIELLEEENPDEEIQIEKPTPRIRVFGGEENRASN